MIAGAFFSQSATRSIDSYLRVRHNTRDRNQVPSLAVAVTYLYVLHKPDSLSPPYGGIKLALVRKLSGPMFGGSVSVSTKGKSEVVQ